jgi:ribonuclease HI
MKVDLWCDGSGTSEGPGGWAYILHCVHPKTGEIFEREGSGGMDQATNNRAELTALIEGLKALKLPSHVTVHSDSEYVIKAFTEGRLERWSTNGWRTRTGVVKNRDLWEVLLVESARHQCEFVWVPGHSDIPLNERCDELAGQARRAVIDAMVEDSLEMAL